MTKLYPIFILAGGMATRLQPVTETIPKALIPINGTPFILHQLRLLKQAGFEEVVIGIGHLGSAIRDLVGSGDNLGLRVRYSEDGPTLLGTAGAIKKALPLLGPAFFVLYGDSYLTCDYTAVQAAFPAEDGTGLMTVYKNDNQGDRSNIEFADGRILQYDKKHLTANMHYIDYGLSLLTPGAFLGLKPGIPADLADLMQALLQTSKLAAFEVLDCFYEVGSFAGIRALEYHLSNGLQSTKDDVWTLLSNTSKKPP